MYSDSLFFTNLYFEQNVTSSFPNDIVRGNPWYLKSCPKFLRQIGKLNTWLNRTGQINGWLVDQVGFQNYVLFFTDLHTLILAATVMESTI